MGYRLFACGHEPTGRDTCPVCGSAALVERCTCGSGAHPRRCELHPNAFDKHVASIDAAQEWDAMLDAFRKQVAAFLVTHPDMQWEIARDFVLVAKALDDGLRGLAPEKENG